jgi:SAM-dependent methyltransferase
VNEYVTDGHLGGYVKGGDEATSYPDLWRWLVEALEISSVLDVGCGEGQALQFFRNLGCTVQGIDGIPQPDPDIVQHDFTVGPRHLDRHFDLVWSCEFVEHVEERYMPNFLAAFKAGALVLMTHADPGQNGYHHVNCRPADYWIGAMAAAGLQLDVDLTAQTRALARFNTSPWNHYARSGLAFLKPMPTRSNPKMEGP